MNIKIDYIEYAEKVNIENILVSSKLWDDLYITICDYIPPETIVYSSTHISFGWNHFISIKGNIGQFIKAHEDEVKILFTKEAKLRLQLENDNSYSKALKSGHRSENEIENILTDKGFVRKLTDNQIGNLVKISNLPGAATFSVPGAGKTTEALAYFFVNSSDIDRLLVVAPKNAFGAWDEQIKSCVPNINDGFVRLRGGEDTISRLIKSNPRFMLVTYEQIPRIRSLMIELLSKGNVYMFLDESHRIKGGKQAKRAESILEIAHLPKRKLIMSGTPMPQSPKDLISQFLFLYPSKYVSEYDVIDAIQPIYVRTTKGQLNIPEVSHIVVSLKMTTLQRNIYRLLKSEIKRQINSVLPDTSKFELRRIGKCVMKLMEFVSNPALLASDMTFVFDRRIGNLLLEDNGPKIAYVCRRARELASENKKVLIWSCFVKNVELIAMRLADLGAVYIHGGVDAGDENDFETREGKIKQFHDDPNCMVMVANPAACSEGISLHKVCQYAIYLDRSFNAAHYLQSEDRIHRLGLAYNAKPTVEIIECENSIDQVVRERLTLKIDVMANALNDESLNVNADIFDYDEDENNDEDDTSKLSIDDARAVMNYFFDGDNDD